jgi:RNA polymerase sigma-70 factor (ECF subfamily)
MGTETTILIQDMDMPADRFLPEIEEIYREHKTAYYNYLLKLTGDAASAQDLLHESFLKMAAKLGGLKDPDRVLQWGYRIVLNTFRDWYRKRARERTVGDKTFEIIPDERFSPEKGCAPGRDIQAAIAGLLNPGEREIFVLSQFRRMSYEEISGLTGVSIRTIGRKMRSAASRIAGFLRRSKVIRGLHCDFRG